MSEEVGEFDVMKELFGEREFEGKLWVPSEDYQDLLGRFFDRREALDALANVMGVINTPIGRRKLGIDLNNPPDWFKEAVKVKMKYA